MNPVKHLIHSPTLKWSGLIIGLIIIVSTLILAHFGAWGFYQSIVEFAKNDAEHWSSDRLVWTIRDELYSMWRQHSIALIRLDSTLDNRKLYSTDLEALSSLPGVLDVFYIDLTTDTVISQNHLTRSDSLAASLNRQRTSQKPHIRDLPQRLATRFGNGVTQLLRVGDSLKDWPMLVRFNNSSDAAKATRAIGMTLDERWFFAQIPSRMDSLMRENTNLMIFGIQEGSHIFPNTPLYTSNDGDFQQTIGVLHGGEKVWETGGDTLWWYGDPSHKVTYLSDEVGPPAFYERLIGSSHRMDAFNLTFGVRVEHLLYKRSMTGSSRFATRMFIMIEAIALLIIGLLSGLVLLIRRQSRRNQIALGHLAHSVKTPVARLQLAADILEGGQVSSPEEERKIIQTVSGECRQLRRAVENAALTMEGGKIAIHKERGDLAGLVKETTDAWWQSFDQAGIKLSVEGVDKPLLASFDHEKLKLALDNLVDNALRHTYLNLKNLNPGQAFVTLSVHHEDTKISVSVTDAGAGIPQSDMKNVFKRFSRSGKDPLTGVSGLGLGLALVKEIVEGHGGKVNAESAEGGGARFIIQMTND